MQLRGQCDVSEGSVALSSRAGGGVEVVLHGAFDDFRVDASHSVDGVRPHDAQMSHVDFFSITLLDQGHSAQTVVISRVELTDALEGQTNEVLNGFHTRCGNPDLDLLDKWNKYSYINGGQIVPQGASCLSHR